MATREELHRKVLTLPKEPGVYIMKNCHGQVIYVGKAKVLKNRVSQYFQNEAKHTPKTRKMVENIDNFDIIVCGSEFEALVLENQMIKKYKPKYNILLKDDKGYSYIRVTREDWPRLSFTLQKEEDGAEYIGPYTSSFAARQMAETAMDAFLLPRCSKRFPQEIGKGRPCLNAHIGKCMAVCSGKISCEAYNQAVKNAVHLIRYGKKDILKTLNERMQEASDRLEFETAALLRDQINAITKLTAGQKVVIDPDVEMDVVALAGTPDSVCAAVLRFREGRLTDKREFLFHDTSDIDAVREEFLPRYYLDDEQIPKIIAVDELPPDSDAPDPMPAEYLSGKAVIIPDYGTNTDTTRVFTRAGVEPAYTDDRLNNRSVLAAVAAGLGSTVFSRLELDHYAQQNLTVRAIDPPCLRELGVAMRPAVKNNPVARSHLRALRRAAADDIA